MRKGLAVAVLAVMFVLGGVSELLAFRPDGWVYFNHPYAYDHSSGDWHWFNASDTQWVNGLSAGGWRLLGASAMASGWSYVRWPYAYCSANGSWYYINEVDTQWVVNLRTGAWARFGQATASMVLIPGGTNAGTDPDFGPYSLTVSSFYMDQYEVTKALWDEVYTWAVANGYSFDNPGSVKAVSHPVHAVNWYDCVKWCNARSQKEGRPAVYTVNGAVYRTGQADNVVQTAVAGYRLPTDTEWEYAARGGVASWRFPWGDTITHSQANYVSSSSYSYDTSPTRGYHPTYNDGVHPYTSPVGSFAANDYGLYDMSGNLWEWCFGWHPGYEGSSRVVRGGSWDAYSDDCRDGDRGSGWPEHPYVNVGFRTVLPPGQQ